MAVVGRQEHGGRGKEHWHRRQDAGKQGTGSRWNGVQQNKGRQTKYLQVAPRKIERNEYRSTWSDPCEEGALEQDEKAGTECDKSTSDFRSFSSGEGGRRRREGHRAEGTKTTTERHGLEMLSRMREEVRQEDGLLACGERDVRAEQVE